MMATNTNPIQTADNEIVAESPESILKKINTSFNNRLMPIQQNTNRDFSPLKLGNPSKPLLEAGFPDLPIEMALRRLVDKKLQHNHPFPLHAVVSMPEYLSCPIAVFRSKTRPEDSKVVLTEMESGNIHLVVAIELDRPKLYGNVNDVRSVYPKDNFEDVLRWIVDGYLEYCDKQKVLKWLGKQQSNSAEVARLLEDSTNIINKL